MIILFFYVNLIDLISHLLVICYWFDFFVVILVFFWIFFRLIWIIVSDDNFVF